jgi:ATP-dependent Lhr-like helicase
MTPLPTRALPPRRLEHRGGGSMAEGNASSRLHASLRHAILHELGWQQLRPVQELAIDAVLSGCNTVVLAPTAGGKTEASIFPVLSQVLSERDQAATDVVAVERVAALYICPIRALLNNQEARIQQYARMVGLDAFKWHGDVAASQKKRFMREPTSVLMITPESLEVMLISQKTDARTLFAGLRCVIVDEVHAFAADDRGAHLVSVLERLARFCGHDLQRIGLSATVGNPATIGEWLAGSSARPFRLVDPPKPKVTRDLSVELLPDMDDVSTRAARIGAGKKSLVFVQSRGQAERVAAAMAGTAMAGAAGGLGNVGTPPMDVFVHHSAISRADRQLAEAQFTEGRNTAIVCTSTMELGIDVGDLDLVMQVDAPATVASLLQRMGRTGRRANTRANATFLTQTPEAMLQAVALLRLMERGWVEDVRPVARAVHILAHQVLALTLQEGGVSRHRIMEQLARAYPYRDLAEADVQRLIDTMLARDILHEAEGLLSLGLEGERVFGRKNFFELYAVFSAPSVMRVMYRRTDVGTIQSQFLRASMDEDRGLAFRLAGRSWQVVDFDFNKGLVQVIPAEHGRVPSWLGTPAYLAYELCQEMKAVLHGGPLPPWLDANGQRELTWMRESYTDLVNPGCAPLEAGGAELQWHTFAGGAVNQLLAQALRDHGAGRWTPGNLTLKSRDPVGASQAMDAIAALREADWNAHARNLVRGRSVTVSKFQLCMPDDLAEALLIERLTSVEATRQFVGAHRVQMVT